jgi:hypothetical protein
MADAVWTKEITRTADAIETAIDDYLADADTPGSFDRSYTVNRGQNKEIMVIEYTQA